MDQGLLGGGAPTSAAYPNFMMDDEGDTRLKATYGDNYARLAAVKNKFDPANLFQATRTSGRPPDAAACDWRPRLRPTV
jgi:hypothetical protein